MLKKEGNIMYMLYDKGMVWLPNPSLSLYVIQNYLIEITEEPVQKTWPEGQDHQWANPPFHLGRYSTDPFGASGSRPQPQFDAG